jgi:hypothetical protein
MSNDRLTSFVDTMTSLFGYIDIILRIHWHPLTRSGKNPPACSHSGKQSCLSSPHLEKKKKISSFWKGSFFSTFQSHETESIESIFAFSIICFSVYTRSIPILLVLDLDVLVPVPFVPVPPVLVSSVLVLCLVFCLGLNQLDEQRALPSYSSHLA